MKEERRVIVIVLVMVMEVGERIATPESQKQLVRGIDELSAACHGGLSLCNEETGPCL